VKDRVETESIETVDIGTNGQLQEWAEIDWRQIKKQVKNLRQRIYRATQDKQWVLFLVCLRLEPLTLKGVRAVLRGGRHGDVSSLTRQEGGWKSIINW
jgi:hypothetical protein